MALDEESLVAKAKRRDAAAFAQLYEAYFERIYRYFVVRVGNAWEAEDLTEQVFLRALESIENYEWRGVSFGAWLFRIAHNLIVDSLRRKSNGTEPLLAAETIPGDDDLEEIVDLNLRIEQVLEVLPLLTNDQRQVIGLRFGAGLPIAESARVMGKSEGAIKALQYNALAALRRLLSKRLNRVAS